MDINARLEKLYCDKIPDLERLVAELKGEDYVSPLLLRCWESHYQSAAMRIMYYGQETNGWCGNVRPVSADSIRRILDEYSEFNMGRSYRSLFWNYVHDMHKAFNPDNNGFMWNNVIKFGGSGIGAPSMKVQNAEIQHFNVMRAEIDILKPHVIVFFSGPNYDGDIERRLGSVRYEKCSDLNERQLAVVKSDGLDCLALRTYHPKYLNFNVALGERILQTMRKIIGDIGSR